MSNINLSKCKIITINRKQIKLADYNPRKISKKNKDNLKKLLERHGLVSFLLWNKRTGNLVSGHQRIEIIDEDKGCLDYDIDVLAIDVTLKEEKAINVSINNKNAQGDFDFDLLSEIGDIDLKEDGLFLDFEIKNLSADFENVNVNTNENYIPEDEFFEKKKKMREKHKNNVENNNTQIDISGSDYTITVVFDSNKQKKEFMDGINKDCYDNIVHFKELVNYG